MTQHRSHAVKDSHAAVDHNQDNHKHPADESRIVSLHSNPVTDPEGAFSLFTWPWQIFGMMMNPWGLLAASPLADKMEQPRSKSHETDREYIYEVDLPGITRDELNLSFENGAIMLQAENTQDRKGKSYHYRQSRSLRRAFTLPVYTDAEAITAQLQDGILTITIPKTDKPSSPKSRVIDVA